MYSVYGLRRLTIDVLIADLSYSAKSAGVTNGIYDGCVLFKCPSKQSQCDSESA